MGVCSRDEERMYLCLCVSVCECLSGCVVCVQERKRECICVSVCPYVCVYLGVWVCV